MKYIVALAGAMLLLAGCATDPGAKISEYQIKSVGIDPRVDASAIRYGNRNDGDVNQALTGLILDAMKSKTMKRLATVMQENKIDVPSMVRSNFVQAVAGLGYEYSENRPDATFVLKLEKHGFDDTKLFSPKAPFAVIEGTLVKANGKVIWRGSSRNGSKELLFGLAASSENDPQVGVKEWEDYEQNSQKLREDWEIVTRKAVADLLKAAKKAQ
ncbi:MAG: hypothetical protein ACXWKG_18500 [Limisphaerales bacterium]